MAGMGAADDVDAAVCGDDDEDGGIGVHCPPISSSMTQWPVGSVNLTGLLLVYE
jgi:hypothetical protein